MGMDLWFGKIISGEEFKENEYKDNGERNYKYSDELEYQRNFGDVESHQVIEEQLDMQTKFKELNLDLCNYEISSIGGNEWEFRHKTSGDYITINESDVSTIIVPVVRVYAKEVCYRRVGFNKSTFDDLVGVQDLICNANISKSEFDGLINKIPKFNEIIRNFYNISPDLDFDIFYIGW